MAGQQFSSKSLSLIERATVFAAEAHKKQLRKGTKIPYIAHPFGVAVLLSRAGCSGEVLAAGILHDTIEDAGSERKRKITERKIKKLFGSRVLSIVKGCSEPDKDKSWEERKEHTIEFLKAAPREVRFVALADKLNNIRAIAYDYKEKGEDLWDRFKRGKKDQKRYYEGLVKALRNASGNEQYRAMHRQFRRQVKQVFST